eukprot:120363_1
MHPNNPLPNTTKQSRNSIAFDQLCIELQYLFVAPSDELIALNYLDLKNASSSKPSTIGYHVPSLIFEKSSLLLRPSTYKEIIEERAATQSCGIPICSNKLKSIPNKNKKYYRLNVNKKEIYEEQDSYFCSKTCFQKSMQFELNLEDVAIQFKSHSLEKIKQALQFIFSWYKGKIKINIPIPSQTPNKSDPKNTNQLTKMVENLKIVEKNVALNLHTQNNTESPEKKWKRPIKISNKKKQPKIEMEVDDNKEEKKDNDNDIPMTKMEELFRIQQQEKLRMKKEANNDGDSNRSKDSVNVAENENGKKVEMNGILNDEILDKIETEKLKMFQDERHRQLYNSLSDKAQIMGYYIGWCTDATSFFIMNDMNGYEHWRDKRMNVYNDVYCDPLLKQRQEMLINNVIKYINGLLGKFKVDVGLTSKICNEVHLLVDTFDITEGIPSWKAKTWCFIAIVFLKLISHRIDGLKKGMFDKNEMIKNVLGTIGFGEEYVDTLEGIVVLDNV